MIAMQLTVSVLAALLLFSMPLQEASAADETVTVEEEFILEEEIPEDDRPDFFSGRDSDIFASAGDVFGTEPEQEEFDSLDLAYPLSPGEEKALAAAMENPDEPNVLTLAILRARKASSILDSLKSGERKTPSEKGLDNPLYLALANALSAAELAPDEPDFLFLVAQVYAAFGPNPFTLELAEEAASGTLELAPSYSEARLLLGILQHQNRSFALAIDNLERAVSEKPALLDFRTASLLGAAYFLENGLPRGEQFFRKYLSSVEPNGTALFCLGVILHGMEELPEAGETMRLAAEAFSQDTEKAVYVRSVLAEWTEGK
jgi:tetratricopeptide (TPR) repeat protein